MRRSHAKPPPARAPARPRLVGLAAGGSKRYLYDPLAKAIVGRVQVGGRDTWVINHVCTTRAQESLDDESSSELLQMMETRLNDRVQTLTTAERPCLSAT